MIKSFAKLIVEWLVKKGTILQEDQELYEYAAYCFILSISPIIIIMVMGSLMGKTIESLLIITPFMFLRKFSGGFHAKQAWICMFCTNGILFICMYTVLYIKYSSILNIITICATISLIIFSPIDSENRKLDLYEKRKYKITASIITFIFLMLYCLLVVYSYTTYAVCVAEGLILTASLQVPCILLNVKERKIRCYRK